MTLAPFMLDRRGRRWRRVDSYGGQHLYAPTWPVLGWKQAQDVDVKGEESHLLDRMPQWFHDSGCWCGPPVKSVAVEGLPEQKQIECEIDLVRQA